MNEVAGPEHVEKEFLVAYDYGMGGVWVILIAPSRAAISAKYPELVIVDDPPAWMDDAELAKLRSAPLSLEDDPPQGLLRALISDRTRD
jgi:hypothetical protein